MRERVERYKVIHAIGMFIEGQELVYSGDGMYSVWLHINGNPELISVAEAILIHYRYYFKPYEPIQANLNFTLPSKTAKVIIRCEDEIGKVISYQELDNIDELRKK